LGKKYRQNMQYIWINFMDTIINEFYKIFKKVTSLLIMLIIQFVCFY